MPASVQLDPNLRVWLVQDWLTGMRGGEKVLRQLVELFPQARIAALLWERGSVDPEIERRVERLSFLQKIPGATRGYRNLLPLMPAAVRRLTLSPCDLVISSSHCVAKGVPIPPGAVHLCYCHTPMRYIWGLEDHYLEQGFSFKRLALRAVTPRLRRVDLASNAGVTRFVANSRNVAERISRFYGRTADVIYPGIDETFYTPATEEPEDFFLIVSALVPYKRLDLAVRAFAPGGPCAGKRLVIVGRGPEEARLRTLAAGAPNIAFHGWLGDEEIRWHYQHCQALLFPGEEDFGLVPVEVQACGRPVIAYARGGALETVTPQTGVLFAEQSVASLGAAVIDFSHQLKAFAPALLRQHALGFTWRRFREKIARITLEILAGCRIASSEKSFLTSAAGNPASPGGPPS